MITRRIVPSETLPLRHQVLRPMLTLDGCATPGDDHPQAIHLGAMDGARMVGVVTLFPEASSEYPHLPAYRLRGMAVDPEYQRRGVGGLLHEAALAELAAEGFKGLLWCNARVTAVGFYRALGWHVVSDEFEIPPLGPHVRMLRGIDIPWPPSAD